MKLLEILILIIPAVAYTLWNGRNGIKHPAWDQVLMVSSIMLITSVMISIIWRVLALKCLLVSITGYALIFPYAFNYLWWKKWYWPSSLKDSRRWFYTLNHLSEKAWPDRLFLKYNVHWLMRLLMYITLFVLSLIWFL